MMHALMGDTMSRWVILYYYEGKLFKVEEEVNIAIARSTGKLLFDQLRWEQTHQVPV